MVQYGPLLFFMPQMVRVKTNEVHRFGSLIQEHNTLYKAKWMKGSRPEDDALLGTMDNSSLADINGSYQPVDEMRFIPVSLRLLTGTAGMLIPPFLPLVFTVYSGMELFQKLLQAVQA